MRKNKELWYFLYRYILKGMTGMFVGIIFVGALATLIPQIAGVEIIRMVIQSIIVNNQERLYVSAILFIIFTIFCIIFKSLYKIMLFKFKKNNIIRLEDKLINTYSSLEIWNQSVPAGEIISIIRQNTTQIVTVFLESIISFSLTIISIIGVAIYVLTINLMSLIICFITTGILVFIAKKSILELQDLQINYSKAFDKLYANSWEHINNIEIISFLNKERVFQSYYNLVEEISDYQIKFNHAKSYSYLFNRFGSIGIILLTSLFGAYLVLNNRLMISDVLAMILALPLISEEIFKIPSFIADFKILDGMKKKLEIVFDMEFYNDSNKVKLNLSKNYKLAVDIDTFSFQNKGKVLFNQVRFNVQNGSFLCIAGPSGCGKSTLLRIIAGLQPLKNGNILINDINIVEILRDELWNKIGYVQQESVIIDDTLCNNIALYDENVDQEKLNMVLEKAQLLQMVCSLPNGLKTMINKNNISSGESQKINIARVFYKDSDIYLFDEATSHINPEAELKIITYLKELAAKHRKLILFVTHDKVILEQSDYVLAFQSVGNIIFSNHYKLMDSNKEYRCMIIKEGNT